MPGGGEAAPDFPLPPNGRFLREGSRTTLGRASFLSTLFRTTMGLSPASRALRRTKRVWGMGPSVHQGGLAVVHVGDEGNVMGAPIPSLGRPLG